MKRTLGSILLVLGVAMLIWTGFSYTKKEKVVDAGPLEISADKQKTVEVGAELFVGNLDPMVDEKTLYDTFSRFGSLVSVPKVCLFISS